MSKKITLAQWKRRAELAEYKLQMMIAFLDRYVDNAEAEILATQVRANQVRALSQNAQSAARNAEFIFNKENPEP